MGKKRRKIDKEKGDTEFGDDYTSMAMEVASYTEMTGAVPRPPLSDAEVENYSDIVSMPQKRADHADRGRQRKREEHL